MRDFALVLILWLAAAPLHAAELQPPTADAGQGAHAVAEVVVHGQRHPVCSQASGGRGLNLACLNQDLQAAAKAGDPPPAAIDAAARDGQTPSKAGTFSQAATAERLGKTFGKSAQPYRPPAQVYAHPILPTGAPR